MKRILNNLIEFLLIALIVVLFGSCVAYNKKTYHTKYPGTSTLQWLLDSHK